MAFWAAFWVSLAMTVVGELLRPKQKFDKPVPSGLADFKFPTADATRMIPVFTGTVKLMGPNVVWFGDLRSAAVTKKVKTGWFSSDRITLGFNYFIGLQLVFGWGGEELEMIDFLVDDKSVLNNIPVDGITETENGYGFVMNKPTLMGNDEPPNGVSGPVKVYKGTKTQPANQYLASKLNDPNPSGFRRLCYAVMEQCYMGNSDTPPPVALVAKLCFNGLQLTDGKHDIDGDANPACWAYEIMTNPIWGLKMDPSLIDAETFRACAYRLFDEGMGISMIVETATSARDLLAEVLRHVDGVIFADPKTGMYVMRLARDDYDVNTLEVFDNANILPGTFEFSRVSWEDTINTTIVNYTDREQNFTAQPVQYQDLANVFVRGGQITSESIDFLSLSNKENALKVAARANKMRSSPFARCSFSTDRTGYSVLPGDVIRLHKPDYGLTGFVVMRVIDVSYGTLDEPIVKITCTEDIFAINAYAYGAPQDTGWVPVYQPASPLSMYRVIEAPYEMNDAESRRLMALGVRADFVTTGFEIWLDTTNTGTQYKLTNMAYGTLPGGVLRSSAGYTHNASTTLVVENVRDSQLLRSVTTEERDRGAALLMVNNEIMAYSGISISETDGAVTVTGLLRGLFDTEQSFHTAGSPVIFFNESIPLVDTLPIAKDGPVKVKLVPFNERESLTLADVPEITVEVSGRAYRPNPIGPIYLNDSDYRITSGNGSYLTGPTGDTKITWEWRNKAYRGGLVHELSTGIEPEPGSGARVRVQQGSRILEIPYTDYQPVYFRFAQDGNITVTIEAIDFDGQVAGVPRTQLIDYYAGTTLTNEIWQPPPPVPVELPVEIEPDVNGMLYIDCTHSHFIVTLNRNATAVFLNVPATKVLLLEVRQQGTYNITWPANVRFVSGTPYVVTPVNGAVDLVGVITLDEGVNWNLKASQAGGGALPLVLTLDANNTSGTASGTAGQNVTASTPAVSGTTTNGEAPITFQWTRTDNSGGPDFVLSAPTESSTTFSLTSAQSTSVTQTWTLTATDAAGMVASASVTVALSTDNAVAGLSVALDPIAAFGSAEYPYNPMASFAAVVTGGSGNFSYEWSKVQGPPGFYIVDNYNTYDSVTIARPNNNVYSSQQAQYRVKVTDNADGAVVYAYGWVELETLQSGGVIP